LKFGYEKTILCTANFTKFEDSESLLQPRKPPGFEFDHVKAFKECLSEV